MNQFVLEEYKLLVAEMQRLMFEARQLELYCAGAVAAIYSWFFASKVTHELAWFFPLLIPTLGLLRSWAFYERVKQIAEYVRQIESTLLENETRITGWENEYAGIRKHGLTPTGMVFWLVLLFTCLVIPFILTSGDG